MASYAVAAFYSAPGGFTTAQFVIENRSELENFHTIYTVFDSVGQGENPISDYNYKMFQLPDG